MAITVHSAGQQTTANDSSASNNQNVTLAAGSNRRLFVCVQVEHAGGNESEGVSAITYGGNALTQVTDGSDPALIDLSVAHIEWFQLLEADMPANGSQALNVTLTVSRQCTVGWIILEGCDQSTNVEFTNFEGATTTATSLTINGFDVPDEGFAILVGWYSNQTGGDTPNHSCTIDGDAATERWDAYNNQGGAFMSGYSRVLTTETGTIPAVLTCDSSNRRCGAGFAVAPAAAASPANISGGFSTAPVLLDATGDTLLAVSGALATAGVTGAIAAEVMVGISGGFTLGAVSVSGTVLPQREISGGFTLGAATVAGGVSSDQNADISGGFSIGAVAVAGALTVEVAISGGFTLGAATVAGEVERAAVEISGGFTLGAVTTAGLVSHERELSGGFVTPAVELSATGDTMIAISGGFSIGAVQLAGGVVHADVPGSVLIADRAYGSVNISDGRSGSVLITDRARDA